MSSVRNANRNGACHLAVVRCMARVRETPSSVGGRSVLCMHESKQKKQQKKKKWQTKDKNDCEAVRRRGGLTSLKGTQHGDSFFSFPARRDQTFISASAAGDVGTPVRHAESG